MDQAKASVGNRFLRRASRAHPAIAGAAAIAVAGLLAVAWVRRGRPPEGPDAIRCADATWDFGVVAQSQPQKLLHTFELTNFSGKPVGVVKVAPDCGCVLLTSVPARIPARSTAQIAIAVNPGGVPGPFGKRIVVSLATAPETDMLLFVKGVVAPTPALYIVPTLLDFGTITHGHVAKRTVRVARYDGTPLDISKILPASSAVRVTAAPENTSDASAELVVSLDSSQIPAQLFESSVKVITSRSAYQTVRIPVQARVIERPAGLIGSIFIDRLPAGSSKDVPLCEPGGAATDVDTIEYDGDSAITVRLIAASAGERTRLPVVRVTRSGSSSGGPRVARGTLVVNAHGLAQPCRIKFGAYLPD